MEAKELMVGNLVFNQMNQVITVGWEQIKFAEDFKPIPLTEEWLLKLGFKKYTENKFFIGFNYGAYSVNKVGDAFDHWYLNHEFDGTKRICHNTRFIHQLQNLYFALTGNELELKQQ